MIRRLITGTAAVLLLTASMAHAESIFGTHAIGVKVRGMSIPAASRGASGLLIADSLNTPIGNPAGWFSTGRTRFSVTGQALMQTVQEGGLSESSSNLRFPTVTLALPIYGSLGLGLSFDQYSDAAFLQYREDTVTMDGEEVAVHERFEAEGGLSRASGYLGLMVGERTSLGLSVDYYFGTIERDWFLTFPREYFNESGRNVRSEMSGVGMRFGTIVRLSDNSTVAGTVKLPTNLMMDSAMQLLGGDSTSLGESDYELPLGFGLAASHRFGRLRPVAAFSMELWGDSPGSIPGVPDATYTPSFDITAGAEYLPSPRPLMPWYDRWTFRGEGHFRRHYVEFGGNPLYEFGGGVGVSIPVRTHPGTLDLSVHFTQRGSESSNGASERIVTFQIGLTSSERWFVQRRR